MCQKIQIKSYIKIIDITQNTFSISDLRFEITEKKSLHENPSHTKKSDNIFVSEVPTLFIGVTNFKKI